MGLRTADITFPVTLFYDGNCPVCMKEIRWLREKDQHQRLILENIQLPGFSERFPFLDPVELDRLLHARLGDGKIVTGVDATLAAWAAVDKGFWIAPLRWPILGWLADLGYRVFARNRHGIARRFAWYFGQPGCDGESCSIDNRTK
ncbi:thiol-disulfide oxidoreductase DCC family protein [Parendozoicomonas haliclonae]|uniref:Thiol-disulfide oxidoreductase DCC n=1 Tax=Parendozoicomonas haliclonae TaxID=1960125 RepID=A0A1X7AMU1_9GAMM|nr:DUF393 domain-containing protein [Parendozoicomonas haliclonae]SMA49406.1 hypothetical protein EHSB41UT_03242 [Parendozoicomonas haliclonae]